MNCEQIQQWILLNDSNELPKSRKQELEQHLNQCASCRDFQALLTQVHQETEPRDEPEAHVVQDVIREIRKNAPQKRSKVLIFRKPILAAAASLFIALGLTFNYQQQNKVGLELTLADTQLMEMEDQLVNAMYEGLSEDDLAFNFLMSFDG